MSIKLDHKATRAFVGKTFAFLAAALVEVGVCAISVTALDVGGIMTLLEALRAIEHGTCSFPISASLQVPNVAAS